MHLLIKMFSGVHPGPEPRAQPRLLKKKDMKHENKTGTEREGTASHSATRGSHNSTCGAAGQPACSAHYGHNRHDGRCGGAADCARSARCDGETTSRSAGGPSSTVACVWGIRLGHKDCNQGLQTPVCIHSAPIQRDTAVAGARGKGSRSAGRNHFPAKQRSYPNSTARAEPERFLFKVFSCPEEGRGSTANIRSAWSEQIHETVQVQNVDTRSSNTLRASRRLVHIHRPKGRLFSHPYLSPSQKISQVCLQGHNIRVSGAPVRPLTKSTGVCKMHRGCHCAPQGGGDARGNVHRRLASGCTVAPANSGTHQSAHRTSGGPGFHNKLGKECFDPNSKHRIHRPVSRFSLVQSSSVSGKSGSLSGLSGTFSQGGDTKVQVVSQAAGVNGISTDSHPIRAPTHETGSAVGCVAQAEPDTPRLPPGYGFLGVRPGAAPLETPAFPNYRRCHGNDPDKESYYNRCLSNRLGSHIRRQDSKWYMELADAVASHKLPGTPGRRTGAETLPALSEGAACSGQDGQYHGSGIYQQTRGAALALSAHVGTQTDYVEQLSPIIAESHARAGHTEPGGRFTVQGQPSLQGLETPQRGSGANMGEIRPSGDRPLCVRGERSVSSILFPDRSERSDGSGCVGSLLAVRPPVRLSPIRADHSYSLQGEGEGSYSDFNSSPLARETLASGDISAAMRSAMASASPQGPPVAGTRRNLPSPPRAHGSVGLARERLNLTTAGLPQSVIATIQSARAPSTRSAYGGKWCAFEDWCVKAGIVAFQSPIPAILTFLQELLDRGLAFSTVKVYLAAISACHIGFGDKTAGQHPLVCQFMKGARRLRPVSRSLTAPWDLSVVLDALSRPPFEPLQQVELKVLSFKTALLLALASAKRVSDIHALSVNPSCMQFLMGDSKVLLKPNPAFVPKVFNPALSYRPIELSAFHPPPFGTQEHERLNALCPVRALRTYVEKTAGFRKSEQLFVSWATPHLGKPLTKQRLSHWIVGAIAMAYNSKGQRAPVGLRAHSTRGMATSWALFQGVSVEEICAAASWATPHTFTRFYKLDVTAPTLSHAVLSVVSAPDMSI